jgi:hypothetical protein
MKHFLNKIAVFFIPVLLFFIVTVTYFFYNRSKIENDLKKISQYECIIMGDSQMQRINPEKFKLKTTNFASSGEHYFFTYKKLKMLTEFRENKIKKVVLGLSTHSFAPVYNKLINTNFAEGRASIVNFLYFVPSQEDNFIQKSDLFSKSIIQGIYKGPELNGLYISKKENPDPTIVNKAFIQHFGTKKNIKPNYESQLKYLLLIAKLCDENNIDLILVSTPYHSLYKKQIEKNYFKILNQTINIIPKARYISFLKDSISPELMSDGNHLNSSGGDIYSKKINNFIVENNKY